MFYNILRNILFIFILQIICKICCNILKKCDSTVFFYIHYILPKGSKLLSAKIGEPWMSGIPNCEAPCNYYQKREQVLKEYWKGWSSKIYPVCYEATDYIWFNYNLSAHFIPVNYQFTRIYILIWQLCWIHKESGRI